MVRIVPLMNIGIDAIPRGLRGVVAMRLGAVPLVNWAG